MFYLSYLKMKCYFSFKNEVLNIVEKVKTRLHNSILITDSFINVFLSKNVVQKLLFITIL